jgi:hypothetical protein
MMKRTATTPASLAAMAVALAAMVAGLPSVDFSFPEINAVGLQVSEAADLRAAVADLVVAASERVAQKDVVRTALESTPAGGTIAKVVLSSSAGLAGAADAAAALNLVTVTVSGIGGSSKVFVAAAVATDTGVSAAPRASTTKGVELYFKDTVYGGSLFANPIAATCERRCSHLRPTLHHPADFFLFRLLFEIGSTQLLCRSTSARWRRKSSVLVWPKMGLWNLSRGCERRTYLGELAAASCGPTQAWGSRRSSF